MADGCRAGDWVEVRATLLEPADRAPGLPAETADKPLLMWVKGFAKADAAPGGAVAVETMSGRVVTGELTMVDPGYHHTFGDPPREISRIGRDLRARLAAWRASAGAGAPGAGDTGVAGTEAGGATGPEYGSSGEAAETDSAAAEGGEWW